MISIVREACFPTRLCFVYDVQLRSQGSKERHSKRPSLSVQMSIASRQLVARTPVKMIYTSLVALISLSLPWRFGFRDLCTRCSNRLHCSLHLAADRSRRGNDPAAATKGDGRITSWRHPLSDVNMYKGNPSAPIVGMGGYVLVCIPARDSVCTYVA